MADDTKLVTSEVLNHFYGNLKKNYLLDEMSDEEVDKMMGIDSDDGEDAGGGA